MHAAGTGLTRGRCRANLQAARRDHDQGTLACLGRGRSFTYEGSGIPLVASAKNQWTVQPEGGRALLASQSEVELKGGMVGRLLEPLLRRRIDQAAERTLAAFKYLVEHDEAPSVSHAELVPVDPPAELSRGRRAH